MTKRELLEEMRCERARWDALIALVPDRLMDVPALYGSWSVKDTVGHVAYYERWALEWLEACVHGKVRVAVHQDLMPVDERNALVWAENKDRSLEEIAAESKRVWERLCQLIAALSEEDVQSPHRFDRYVIPLWGKELPLWECIARNSHWHYQEHYVHLREWLVGQGISVA